MIHVQIPQEAEAATSTTASNDIQGVGHMNIAPYEDRLLKLHRELVEIDSVTGLEHDVGEYLINYLHDRNFRTSRQRLPACDNTPPGRTRFNVLAWPGASSCSSSPPRVLITAHIDTVPPHIPYSIEQKGVYTDTVIRGRGTADTKGSVAAQIIAVEELLATGLIKPTDVMLLYVVGEEEGGDGMRQFSQLLNGPDANNSDLKGPLPVNSFEAAIFGEPTEGKLAKGHKGLLICNVKAKGRAGHSGYPWLGKSANELLMRALIRAMDADLGSSERFGRTTMNVGKFEGGTAGNVIAEAASASIVVRVATEPQATGHERVKARIMDIFNDVDKDAFTVDWVAGYGAVPCAYDVNGFDTTIVSFGTDVPVLQGKHTSYLYGPGSILVAHSADEALTIGDMLRSVEDYKKLILHALVDSP